MKQVAHFQAKPALRQFNSVSQSMGMNENAMKDLKGGVIPEDTRTYWEVEDLTSIEFSLLD